jgi:hypothetical protein
MQLSSCGDTVQQLYCAVLWVDCCVVDGSLKPAKRDSVVLG